MMVLLDYLFLKQRETAPKSKPLAPLSPFRLSFDDNRPPEVVEGTEIYIEHQVRITTLFLS